MRTDSRLSRMLHVLLHMARHDQQFTSEQIAKMLGTNAAVVRRTMGGLREKGYVATTKGRSGGWTIVCDLKKTTLFDINQAIGGTGLFSLGFDNPSPKCAVERVVNKAINSAVEDAQKLLDDRLKKVTLAMLTADFDTICRVEGWVDRHSNSDG
ncbi:MAG: transcriptional regulator [Gammaproteobacteria bacterium]|nr:MAG: transcriptional regulator [Gammaproteobacteria bacterium]